MPPFKAGGFAEAVGDRLADPWKLLSETTAFISRTPLMKEYEDQLRRLRSELQTCRGAADTVRRIRAELVEIRKTLRLQGWDVSLGSLNLVFDGFRNDACMAEGFRRLVLFLGDQGGWWLTGESNHINLAEYLEERVLAAGQGRVRERHFLWYRWHGGDLVLSGSATETKEDFERLRSIGEATPLRLLSVLKKLR